MTQSQLSLEQIERLENPFHAVSSISKWAGRENGIRFIGDIPYIRAGNLYFYFGSYEDGYRFIVSSSQDLGELR